MNRLVKTTCGSCGQEVERLNPAWARKRRGQSGRSLTEVATEMGISPTYLSFMETGHKPFTAEMERRFLKAIGEGE